MCEIFSDRSDSTGLIVLNKLNYSTKVELLKRFCDDIQASTNRKLIGYDQLLEKLRESGRLRNMVVHANWESTDDEGYTYTRLKISKDGMLQEYVQFTEESMEKITELILRTQNQLFDTWESKNDTSNQQVK